MTIFLNIKLQATVNRAILIKLKHKIKIGKKKRFKKNMERLYKFEIKIIST